MKKCINRLGKQNLKCETRWLVYLVFCAFGLISTLILGILVGVKIIDWNWLTGQILGSVTAILAFLLANYSLKILLKTENYYLYYFFYTLRLGLYAVPLLLALLIPSHPFYWIGVVIGLAPVLLIPFFQSWLVRFRSPKSVNE